MILLLAVWVLVLGLSYDDTDAPSFTVPDGVNTKLQKMYAKS